MKPQHSAMLGNSEILRAIPPATLSKLVRVFAGRTVRVPAKPQTLRRTVPDLSEAEARAVVGIAGDTVVYFRRRDAIQARQARVRVLRANGFSVGDIALEVGLSETRVRQIIKESST